MKTAHRISVKGQEVPSPANRRARESILTRVLLICGVMSSVLYLGMNVFIPMRYAGYDSASRVVSELSAIDAPTRPIWVAWAAVYTFLLFAFGFGVWKSSRGNRLLQFIGIALIAQGAIGPFWPPMHRREVLAAGAGDMSDTLHIVFTAIWGCLAMASIFCGAIALGKRFRTYSIVTFVVLILFGVLTSIDSPRMQANLPTPLIGVWERINIGAFMLWIAVLALTLWHEPRSAATK